MKRLPFVLFFSLFALILSATLQDNQAVERETVTTQALRNQMNQINSRDWIRINIAMRDQIDRPALGREVSTMGRKERRRAVVEALKSFTEKDQEGLLQFLREREVNGEAKEIRSIWINNVVSAEVKKGVIPTLSKMEGIRSIDWDEERNMLLFTEGADPPRIASLEWNISLINAPAVWAQGFTGMGVVVGSFDTGVNYNHVDLLDHIWTNPGEIPSNGIDDDGNGYVDDIYGYDFNGGSWDPMDGHGHGTHTAGTVAGDGTAGDTTGVAPDAEIMILKVLSNGGGGLESDVWDAISYAVAEGAHVMTFSIGWSHAWGPDRTAWRNALDNALSAGVHASVAAGNEDNFYNPPDNVRTPGDVPPPWLHPDQTLTGGLSGVVTVGATDNSDSIASFSSRGPVEWDFAPWFDYAYNPGIGLIDPDVSAPGVCVTSLNAFNNTSYVSCWNGTSMATPHVAGLMALMLSKNPSLSPALVDSIIEVTAIELGLPGKDNTYGSGRINALAAINAVPASNSPNLHMIDYTLIDTLVGDGDGRPESNETVELVVTLENQIGVQDASLVQGTLSTNDTTLTLIDSTASFPDIPSGTSADNGGNPFLFTVAPGVVPHWATLILEITAEPNSFSTTDSFTIRVGRPEILLVDDDEGALYEDYYIAPLESLQIYYDQWNILSSGLPGTELTQYSCVIWFTGDDDTTTLTLQDESDLTAFLDGGGNLFLSGQNIGEDIGGISTFYANYLRSTFLQGNANDNLLLGVPGDEIGAGLSLAIQGVNGAGNADSEDKIAPLSGANAVFTYNTALGTSALKYDSGIFRVVYFAFPFEAIHGAGAFASRDTVMARVLGWLCASAVGVEEEERESRAKSQTLTLFQNQPNPFHHTTTIQYQIPMKNAVKLAIYDLSGRLVETLVDYSQEPGVYQIQWEGRDQASGIYFYRLTFGKELAIRKMTLLR